MIEVGFFSELGLFADNGSIKDYLSDHVDYNKEIIIQYLKSSSYFSSCPKYLKDCITGKKISDQVLLFNDGKYCWSDALTYHVEKYDIILSEDFIQHILNKN